MKLIQHPVSFPFSHLPAYIPTYKEKKEKEKRREREKLGTMGFHSREYVNTCPY